MAVVREWSDDAGVFALPGGARVRGRRLRAAAGPHGRWPSREKGARSNASASPAGFGLMLADGPPPPWPHRRVRWPDFWVPLDRADALAALREAHARAYRGERVEVACRGGLGRTGTALAALAVLDGLAPEAAVDWVRGAYDRRAVETPWQRRWLRHLRR